MVMEIFWADQIAKKIINRKKYKYVNKVIPKFEVYTVKTSASLSGVLHIGRLSDTTRADAVVRALKDVGVKVRLIWVAEDMDPLRKVPKGVAKHFERYIGTPVSSVPDPEGCHESYAEHFKDQYFKVLDEFVFNKFKKYSMTEEYNKGNFLPYIKKILSNVEKIIELQNKYRKLPLRKWYPWAPVCENCGKLATTSVIEINEGVLKYKCQDYRFESKVAKGCGYVGYNDPLKDRGKLRWKSEWAVGWVRWKVVCEGAGKEYQVPGSAFWINAEIVEKVLGFPMPEPIFYEHLMINGVKMSASVGNVIYPYEWLKVAPPELLRFFYNKRLMKTRSFSWKYLPVLYDDYDYHAKVYYDMVKIDDKKAKHMKRLYEVSNPKLTKPIKASFSHIAILAQVFDDDKLIINSLEKTGHYSDDQHNLIMDRIKKARTWLKDYAPEEVKFKLEFRKVELTEKQKKALRMIADVLKKKDFNEDELFEEFYKICNSIGLKPRKLFEAGYKVLFNQDKGPKLAPFILAVGKEKIIRLFESLS